MKTSTTTRPRNPYDTLTLEIERADSLTILIARRLSALDEAIDHSGVASGELYALSLIADSVSDKLKTIFDNARELQRAKAGAA